MKFAFFFRQIVCCASQKLLQSFPSLNWTSPAPCFSHSTASKSSLYPQFRIPKKSSSKNPRCSSIFSPRKHAEFKREDWQWLSASEWICINKKLPIVGLIKKDRLAVLQRLLLVIFRIETVCEIKMVWTETETREIIDGNGGKIARPELNINFLFFWNNGFNVSEITEQVVNLPQWHPLLQIIADHSIVVYRTGLELYAWWGQVLLRGLITSNTSYWLVSPSLLFLF